MVLRGLVLKSESQTNLPQAQKNLLRLNFSLLSTESFINMQLEVCRKSFADWCDKRFVLNPNFTISASMCTKRYCSVCFVQCLKRGQSRARTTHACFIVIMGLLTIPWAWQFLVGKNIALLKQPLYSESRPGSVFSSSPSQEDCQGDSFSRRERHQKDCSDGSAKDPGRILPGVNERMTENGGKVHYTTHLLWILMFRQAMLRLWNLITTELSEGKIFSTDISLTARATSFLC